MDLEALAKCLEEMDPSDDYHNDDQEIEHIDSRSYYLAIDRAIYLLRGQIDNWRSPKPTI